MDKNYVINLSLTLYESSKNWKKSDFLVFKIKNLANQILSNFILLLHLNTQDIQNTILNEIQVFQKTLNQIRAKKAINRNDFLFFQKEYNNLKEELEKSTHIKAIFDEINYTSIVKNKEKIEKVLIESGTNFKPVSQKTDLNKRQKKILEILTQKQQAQVWELKQFFSDTSKRTLRRDLDDLLGKGLVQRKGEWNKIFYTLV